MAEWDHPRSMLRRIRGVGYAVVALSLLRILNINPRNVPGSIPGAGRVWQFSLYLFILSFSTFCQVMSPERCPTSLGGSEHHCPVLTIEIAFL